MSERFRYEPITEPNTPAPVLDPEFLPLEPAEFAFTQRQRLAILERDGNRCQATVPHGHNYNKPLEVDHIIPQRYGKNLGLTEEDLDVPTNALTKCVNAHDLKHRDRISAREKWREGDKQSFTEMFNERGELLDHGVIYWNPDYDRTDLVRALQLTSKAKKRGWEFPSKKKKVQ